MPGARGAVCCRPNPHNTCSAACCTEPLCPPALACFTEGMRRPLQAAGLLWPADRGARRQHRPAHCVQEGHRPASGHECGSGSSGGGKCRRQSCAVRRVSAGCPAHVPRRVFALGGRVPDAGVPAGKQGRAAIGECSAGMGAELLYFGPVLSWPGRLLRGQGGDYSLRTRWQRPRLQGTSGKGGIGFLGNLRDLLWIPLQQASSAAFVLGRPALLCPAEGAQPLCTWQPPSGHREPPSLTLAPLPPYLAARLPPRQPGRV